MRRAWPEVLMKIAEVIARKRSLCLKQQTAALIVRKNRIVATGYNGTVAGSEECHDYWRGQYEQDPSVAPSFDEWLKSEDFKVKHRIWSLDNEVHAEANALLFACRSGIKVKKCSMYCLHLPCNRCAMMIIQSGIGAVYYKNHNPKYLVNIKFMQSHGVKVIQVL